MSSPSGPSAEAAAPAQEENPAAAAAAVGGGGARKRDREDALEDALEVKDRELKRTKTTVCAAARHLVCAITRGEMLDSSWVVSWYRGIVRVLGKRRHDRECAGTMGDTCVQCDLLTYITYSYAISIVY
mmetsp:Transcript_36738/g.74860  ORF Transcript_36738/g.74860 Transcript_36738/m.74860 type:complete len:129 (-) Transcript_36738:220-606(-)